MNWKSLTLLLVAVGVAGALIYRAQRTDTPTAGEAAEAAVASAAPAPKAAPQPLPRLVELGSDSCASCKAMFPVLEELRASHGDRLRVQFYDVWEDKARAEQYEVRTIPMQVFEGPDGRELFRHMGFFSADGIRAKWADLGYPLTEAGAATGG